MRTILTAATLLLAACAAPIGNLAPASPQPDAAALAPGLAVAYAYPRDVRNLGVARSYRGEARPGPPLQGLDYPDTKRGETALTSRQPERVVAFIDGWIRFDEPGAYKVRFWSNDGLEAKIGGAAVHVDDLRHACRNLGWRDVAIPEAGWYRVEAVWFQRLNTSCLMMDWRTPDGAEGRVPADRFAHVAR